MTAAFASDQRLENGAEQLESLRRQMALLSEKVSGGPSRSGDLVPAGPVSLPPGTVGVLSGARSLLLSMVASVTAAGGNAAIVGQPDIGLLAAVEMGADLSRLALAHPWRSSGPRTSAPPPPPPADAVELRVLNDGVFVGSSVAPTTIDIFNEPICPPCGSFIRSYASDIDTAVADKQLAVRYHLLNFLDDQSHSKNYSTRAVAASYCVAGQNDPKLYASFYSALFGSDFQPQENAASDRTDAELAHLAQTVGAEPTAISCIKSGADLGTAQTKATNASETLAGFNASGTPFVWDGSMVVNYQDPSWLARLIG